MRHRLPRVLRHRYSLAAGRMTVRARRPWYWRPLRLIGLLGLGYALAYWQFVGRYAHPLDPTAAQKLEDVQAMQTRIAQLESQLKVSGVAQSRLAHDLAGMQDESLRMKEEVAFYKGILTENGAPGETRIHRITLNKGSKPGEYRYQVLLVQSGRHDKEIQGSLQLILNGTEDGKPATAHVEPSGQSKGIPVKFRYYQRIDGAFSVPARLAAPTLQVQYASQAKKTPLVQTVNLPD